MTNDEAKENINTILEDELRCAADEITPEAKLVSDLGADSLDLIDLAVCLEEEFEVNINDNTMESLKTVGDVYDYIYRNSELVE